MASTTRRLAAILAADDDPVQEDLGRDAHGCADGDLGSEDSGDPMPIPSEHTTALGEYRVRSCYRLRKSRTARRLFAKT